MKHIITFTDIDNPEGVLEKPRPASEFIPEWYKNAKTYLHPSGKQKLIDDGSPYSSVKKCMPVFDMMTAGYIMQTPYDIYITQTPDGPYFQWGEMKAIHFQSMEQTQNHPYFRDINYAARIIHPWSIKTPKGWSIMVMEPQHHEPGPIAVSSGIVDTDKHQMPFNIFLKLRDSNFEGVIEAGTPLVQIIPFKRQDWESRLGKEKDKDNIKVYSRKWNTRFFDQYKKMSWSRKSYK
jgi:hypothetical protein